MHQGIVREIKGKYVICNVKSPVFRNDLYYTVIPNDTVSYSITEKGEIVFEDLLERKPCVTLAVVRGKSKGKNFLFCPILSSIYNPAFVCKDLNLYDRILCRMGKDSIEILKNYGSIENRSRDSESFIDLFRYSVQSLPLTSTNSPSLLEPFQDLRSLKTINIDPKESKDFDDAFSIDLEEHKIYVHIVDISFWLSSCPELLQSARELGFTLYLSDSNYPIFPREKVEKEWTLLKGENRNVITTEILYDPENYTLVSFKIYPAVINITERYDYEQVQEILETSSEEEWLFLRKFTEKWLKPSLYLPTFCMKIENGKLVRYWKEDTNNLSHKLIETLMVLNNVLVSQYCTQRNVKIPQRFHDKLTGHRKIEDISLLGDPEVDALLQVKCYSRAKYELYLHGHFGLSVDEYTHFTSPMRRMVDVIVHLMLAGKRYDIKELEEMFDYWNTRKDLTEKIGDLEKQWKLLDYLRQNSCILNCIIYLISKAGISYYIPDIQIDGFLHISKIDPSVQWTYLEESLMGSNNVKIEKGQRFKCEVTNIRLASLQWDLKLFF